ncbi:TetR/AcrR family transcriptional regulator [Paenibacillus piri]|uniref:TetR/AcrR family transcriptional regulator n=1 Tax=Paenibacillus piri TaxID=2547395 RepID=A0A4R5KNM0_9BACL|nr:TetR/AcrR family transcriptional regulator [Paenibacillus piri]TDF96267.1 TetR/AcrR family transcriptional regulator [Paenibacillus piri]
MSPRTKEQNDEIRERRKQQILETAETLFLQNGMQLDIRDVALKAGLGYGTVYHYYNNKHLLIHDIMEAGFAAAEELPKRLDAAQMPLEQLHGCLRQLPDSWTASRALFAVCKQAAERFMMFEPELQHSYSLRFESFIYNPVVNLIEDAIRQQELPPGLDPQQTANTLLGALIGAYSIYNNHNSGRFDAGFTANVLIQGIKATQQEAVQA